MADNISTKISKLINLGNEKLTQKGITTTQTTMRDVIDSIADIQIGITDEQLDQWAEVNTQLEEAVGPYTIETTTASYFTFEGSTVTGWAGPDEVTEIIIPRSYSMSQETISMNGAPIKKDAVISTLTSFTEVVFCKSDGSNQVTYTSPSQLSSNFNTDFPDDDVVLVSLRVNLFNGNLKNKLNAILVAPFIAATSSTAEKIYYTNVEDFTNTLFVLSSSAYFSGDVISATYFDGNDYQITAIGSNAFSNNILKRIIMLDNITTLSDSSFRNCTSLTDITIPDTITSIANNAFQSCSSLQSINIPNSVTSIGSYAFSGCYNLTSITIPDSVTSIGEYAFQNCSSLTNIPNIFDNFTTISKGMFSGCTSLINVTIPNTIVTIGSYAFDGCSSLQSIEIPSGITSIQNYTFRNCTSLRDVQLSDSINTIGNYAFGGCESFTSVIVPNSVTSIGESAFEECTSLQSLTIGSNVTSIGDRAFYNTTALTEINFNAINCTVNPTDFQEDNNVFTYAGRNSDGITVNFGDGVTKVPDYLFYSYYNAGNYQPKIINIIWNNITTIGRNAFCENEGLTNLTISIKITTIGSYAFEDCSALETVTFGDNSKLESIGSYAFYGCDALKTVTFGANSQLESIEYGAFYSCRGLTSIDIPSSVTSIGSQNFENCDKLENITVDPNNSYYSSEDGILFNKDKTELIQYPIGNTRTQYTIPSSVTSIGSQAFSGCDALETVTFGENSQLENIKYQAFSQCSKLTSIIMPSSVTSIGSAAFLNCDSLISIIIPDSVTSIGSDVFSSCNSLKEITLPTNDNFKTINEDTFDSCTSLASVTIPSSVTSIGSGAFRGCSSLTTITIPSNVTSIGNYAFNSCTSLAEITVLAETPPTIQADTFNNGPDNRVFYVPDASVDAYKTETNWVQYADKIQPLSAKGGTN